MIVAYKFLDILPHKGELTIVSPLYNGKGVWKDLKIEAVCDPQHAHGQRIPHTDPAPNDNCICGIHAVKTLEEAMQQNSYGGFLCRLILWGKIVEGERGYRAQYARVDSIIPFPCGMYYGVLAGRHLYDETKNNGLWYMHGVRGTNDRIVSTIYCDECYEKEVHFDYGRTQQPIPLSHIGLALGIPVDYEYYQRYHDEENKIHQEEMEKRRKEEQRKREEQQRAAAYIPPLVVQNSPNVITPKPNYMVNDYVRILKSPITMKDGENYRAWKKTRLGSKNMKFMLRIRKELLAVGVGMDESRVAAIFVLDKIQYHSYYAKPFQNDSATDYMWKNLAEATQLCSDVWRAESRYVGLYRKLVGNK